MQGHRAREWRCNAPPSLGVDPAAKIWDDAKLCLVHFGIPKMDSDNVLGIIPNNDNHDNPNMLIIIMIIPNVLGNIIPYNHRPTGTNRGSEHCSCGYLGLKMMTTGDITKVIDEMLSK